MTGAPMPQALSWDGVGGHTDTATLVGWTRRDDTQAWLGGVGYSQH